MAKPFAWKIALSFVTYHSEFLGVLAILEIIGVAYWEQFGYRIDRVSKPRTRIGKRTRTAVGVGGEGETPASTRLDRAICWGWGYSDRFYFQRIDKIST